MYDPVRYIYIYRHRQIVRYWKHRHIGSIAGSTDTAGSTILYEMYGSTTITLVALSCTHSHIGSTILYTQSHW